MTEITVKTLNELTVTDQIGMLEHEISQAERLIQDRHTWLDNNKMKSTHAAIAADTREMEDKLREKKAELEDLKKKVA